MPKIIFTSRYIKNAPSHAGNLLKYMGTRKGAEPLHQLNATRPATGNQQKLIAEIVRAAPDVKGTFEYEDYSAAPSIYNASELITAAFENNSALWSNVRNYVDYIARRPRAERSQIAGHGLWNGSDDKIVLSRAADEVANHKGNIWTHVVSLRREDATRLGYDNAAAWRDLVRSKVQVIADSMKIPITELRWFGAFHDESHHPHCHLLVYSADPKYGYLTESSIEKMRSAFGTTIFQHDLLHIYEQKDMRREQVKEYAGQRMRELMGEIESGAVENPVVAALMIELSAKLRAATGKKQYGYLKPDVKHLVDAIVGHLARDPRVAEMYGHWCELAADIKRTYTGNIPDPPPLAEEKTFKSIKNMVIQYAVAMAEPIPAQEISVAQMDRLEETPLPDTEPEQNIEADSKPSRDDDPHPLEPLLSPDVLSFHAPSSGVTGNLLFHLARMIQQDYARQRQTYEQHADRKLMQKIRRKQQNLGQKLEM